jgi:hypothetical protein
VKGGARYGLVIATLLAAGCEAAEGVRVQQLPPLERSSPEARLGLPEVLGAWRFAGWELEPADSARLAESLPSFGEIRLEVQRLDSIAGSYLVAGARFPLVGDVRRDSVIALVAEAGEGGRFLAGRVAGDTLWLSVATLLEPGSWPAGARAAFVRTPVAATFARLQGQPTILPGDTIQPVLAGPVELPAGEVGATPEPPVTQPGETVPAQRPAAPAAAPVTTTPVAQPTAPRAQPEQPRAAPPVARPAEPPPPTPTEPAEEPPRRAPPRLLGEPVQRDTVPS